MNISDENQENLHNGVSQGSLAHHLSVSSQSSRSSSIVEDQETMFELRVISSISTKSWVLRRTYEELRTLDSQLHR